MTSQQSSEKCLLQTLDSAVRSFSLTFKARNYFVSSFYLQETDACAHKVLQLLWFHNLQTCHPAFPT